jgi:8-oxo-dGTP diphosphatase
MLQVVAALIEMDGFILLCRRKANEKRFPLKWEFPGGKVESGETAQEAIIRELQEELGIRVIASEEAISYTYAYPGERPIRLMFFRITQFDGTVQNRQFEQISWLRSSKLPEYDILEGDRKCVDLLKKGEI